MPLATTPPFRETSTATEYRHPSGGKVAAEGARMFRRSEVQQLVRKLIAKAHVEANDLAATGSLSAFSAVRHKIAAYYAVLSEVQQLPVFLNPASAEQWNEPMDVQEMLKRERGDGE